MFKFVTRYDGHWDVYVENSRVARIRGEASVRNVQLIGEPGNMYFETDVTFPSVESCMAYVCGTLINAPL